ncbi:MAG: DUF4368 domain-containing protein, partial [Oscillospiraceae bacterium]|nr:DUF4368 domain-containing protein [Oscillospiraceae bacterium]
RKKGAVCNLQCGGYKTYGVKECSNHTIDYDTLYNTVLCELQRLLSMSVEDREKFVNRLVEAERAQEHSALKSSVSQQYEDNKERVKTLHTLLKQLYEDRVSGKLSETSFEKLSEECRSELSALEQDIAEHERNSDIDTSVSALYKRFFALLSDITDIKELSKPLLQRLIDHIEVSQGYYVTDEQGKRRKHQEVKIYYRFIGNIKQ